MSVAVCLAFILAGYVFLYSPVIQLQCPPGPATYTGLVSNLTDVGVPGVVVELFTKPSCPGELGITVTNASGRWSLTLNGCPHEANFYWTSASDGPHVFASANRPFPRVSTVQTDVSWQSVNLTWVRQYPNDRNVSINFTLSGSILAETNAITSGHPATGFLSHTSSGAPGSSAVLQGNVSFSQDTPYSVLWVAGTAYRVGDINGSLVTYLALWPNLEFRLLETQEYMTMEAAIEADRASAVYPFKSMAPLGNETVVSLFRWALGNATVNVTVLGATIPVTFNLRGPLTERVAATLVNSNPYNQCYAWFPNAVEEHWWYYGNGTCPPS